MWCASTQRCACSRGTGSRVAAASARRRAAGSRGSCGRPRASSRPVRPPRRSAASQHRRRAVSARAVASSISRPPVRVAGEARRPCGPRPGSDRPRCAPAAPRRQCLLGDRDERVRVRAPNVGASTECSTAGVVRVAGASAEPPVSRAGRTLPRKRARRSARAHRREPVDRLHHERPSSREAGPRITTEPSSA